MSRKMAEMGKLRTRKPQPRFSIRENGFWWTRTVGPEYVTYYLYSRVGTKELRTEERVALSESRAFIAERVRATRDLHRKSVPTLLAVEGADRELFAVPSPCDMNTPFGDLHFWKWLEENRRKHTNHIDEMCAYLQDIGFDRSKHRLSQTTIAVLCSAQHQFGYVPRKVIEGGL